MSPKPSNSRSREENLNGKTLGVINSLAAVLAATTVDSSSKKRKMIAQEFARAYGILGKLWAEHYERSVAKEKKHLRRRSKEVAEKACEMAKGSGVCCVSIKKICQATMDQAACMACDPRATYACIRKPIEYPEM